MTWILQVLLLSLRFACEGMNYCFIITTFLTEKESMTISPFALPFRLGKNLMRHVKCPLRMQKPCFNICVKKREIE